jgi:hypothetical protein
MKTCKHQNHSGGMGAKKIYRDDFHIPQQQGFLGPVIDISVPECNKKEQNGEL